MVCWLNGSIVDTDQAQISIFDHGLLYGDGVFEGLRFYNHTVFRGPAHIARLFESAQALMLNIPYSAAQLMSALTTTAAAHVEKNGYLRIVVTRGTGALGIDPSSCKQAATFIIADKLTFASDMVYQHGARLIIANTRRLSSDGLDPRIKSLNYLNHILARIEANNAGADEAILLNQQGKVTEGSTDNIFLVKDSVLYTPPVSDGALAGITRDAVLQLAGELGIDARQQSLTAFDLYNADECLLTGTAAELIPVQSIDGRKIAACPGPVFQRLNKAFHGMIEHETRDPQYTGQVYESSISR